MGRHIVVEIIDSNILRIEPGWKHQSQYGTLIKINGYKISKLNERQKTSIEKRLSYLVMDKCVEIRSIRKIQDSTLECDVYINGFNLADYFPDFQ